MKDSGKNTTSLFHKYYQEVQPKLQAKLGVKNPMALPRLAKVVVNIGLGEAVSNKKALEQAAKDLAIITGQKPIFTRAHRSIATFKIVAGDTIGAKVTLRGKRMYDFIQKMISTVLPRVRDFRGANPKSFDGRGNYSLGFKEQIVFPEIEYGKIEKTRGLEITISTTAKTDQEARTLLELLGLPFQKS